MGAAGLAARMELEADEQPQPPREHLPLPLGQLIEGPPLAGPLDQAVPLRGLSHRGDPILVNLSPVGSIGPVRRIAHRVPR